MLIKSKIHTSFFQWFRSKLPSCWFSPTREELLQLLYPEYYTNEPYSLEKDPTYNEKMSNNPGSYEFMGKWVVNYYNETSIFYTSDYCSNCPECMSRNGKVMSYKDWEIIGLPMSNLLPCLHNCSCDLDWNPTSPGEFKEIYEREGYISKKTKRPEISE
ncbi:MAG: hypothetical protein H8E85_07335, partial [Candidatus Marinimicrobia bacterium]|nr:hypothetical protein [Candidatus Neomarinimicrobiota bacterium]